MGLSYEVYAVLVRSSISENPPSGRTVLLPASDQIAQTIWMPTQGFQSFTLWFGPAKGPARGLSIELREIRYDGETPLLYRFLVAPGQITAGPRTFRFSPVRDPAAKYFRIELRETGVEGEAVTVVANRESTYGGGALYVSGREQWGDLAFSTMADVATLYGNVRHALKRQIPGFASLYVLLSLFAIYNWAFATFIYYMVFAEEEEF